MFIIYVRMVDIVYLCLYNEDVIRIGENIMLERLRDDFKKVFEVECTTNYFSPGRVNLIGEHTDYNGGMVFPCAITYGTYAVVRKREDRIVRLYSNNFQNIGIVEVSLDALVFDKKDDWANYAKGVMYFLQEEGYNLTGFDILLEGNIPNGAGLSSSASLEVLIGTICKEECNLSIDMVEIVKISQKAENKFIGVNCGIMDQFIIGMGKKNHAIALNTATLEYVYAPVQLDDASIVIMNTNKQRGLADSKYNERRGECEEALAILQKHKDIQTLCDLSVKEFEEISHYIKNEVILKRAKHAISENERVKEAITALENNDITTFGKLMNASHISLRDDYEVTGKELDTLVSSAWKQDGVIGARMTGAGFGGCAIALVKNDKIEEFKTNVSKEYTEVIGYAPDFYIASIGDGARKVC